MGTTFKEWTDERTESDVPPRFQKCLGYPEKNPTAPIYSVFTYHGSRTLQQHLREWEPSSTIVAGIFKQIGEALFDLSSLPRPLIHHNLHRKNIFVQGLSKLGVPQLVFTDFAASQVYMPPEASPVIRVRSMSKESTINYAPPEWSIYYKQYAYCKRCEPSSFDMYSAGNLFVEVLAGATAFELTSHPGVIGNIAPFGRSECRRRSFAVLQQYLHESADPFSALVELMQLHKKEFSKPGMMAIKADPQGTRFVNKYLVQMLHMEPTKRIRPKDLLRSSWLQDVSRREAHAILSEGQISGKELPNSVDDVPQDMGIDSIIAMNELFGSDGFSPEDKKVPMNNDQGATFTNAGVYVS